jgi:lipopolysaccharide export system protein LptC
LHAYVNEERVKSHLPVVLTRGADQFSGDTFAYNNVTGIVELKGRVKGLMVPRASVAKP